MPTTLPRMLVLQLEMHIGGQILSAKRLSGGGINDVYKLSSSNGKFVVKVSQRQMPHLFFSEAQGLNLLAQAEALQVPKVVAYGDIMGQTDYLLMTYLQGQEPTAQLEEQFGRGLAALHRHSSVTFGGTINNYFGMLPQENPPLPTAAEFFWQARLQPQLNLAKGKLSAADLTQFETLQTRLTRLIPAELPALVHGDLWHGNILYAQTGPALIDPALIDPAASYSHREVDLAAMKLFGGVSDRVFAAYNEAFSVAAGWEN